MKTIGTKVASFSVLRTCRLFPQVILLALISVKRLSRPHSPTAAGRFSSKKNANDTFGNRTLYFPACSVVPHPTAPRHTPCISLQSSDVYGSTIDLSRRRQDPGQYVVQNLVTRSVKVCALYWSTFLQSCL